MLNSGSNLYESDYDQRTALHLATSEGCVAAVKFLINQAPKTNRDKVISPKDRWGGTPLGEAIHYGHTEIADILREAGGVLGNQSHFKKKKKTVQTGENKQLGNAEILFAASEGDLFEVIRLYASGNSISAADYDGRTPLHLAASNGHSKVVKYLIVQSTKLTDIETPIWEAVDRFGNMAVDDAIREGHTTC